MSSRKQTWIGLVAVLIAIVTYVSLFGVQTSAALFAHYKFRKIPEVSKTPSVLTNPSVSPMPHTRVSYFGFEFELPWDDVDDLKSKTAGTIRITAFHSGNALWFSTFPPKSFVNGLMQTAKLDPETFRQVYGNEAFQSDYGFMTKMLQMTPGNISPFGSKKDAVAGTMLLIIKAISMPKADSGIFNIRTADFRGFQFGDPRSRPFRITDELYREDGGVDLIFFQKVDGSAPTVTQPEINRILRSIHKISSVIAVSNANSVK